MYYTESVIAVEVTRVLERMRDGLFHCKLVASRLDADLVLKEWSKLVMTKFKADNLPLAARTDTPDGVAHITGALTMLNSSEALWQSESAARMKELVDKLDASNSEVAQLRMQVTSLKSLLSTRGMKSPVRSLKSPVVRKSPFDVGAQVRSNFADVSAPSGKKAGQCKTIQVLREFFICALGLVAREDNYFCIDN